MVEDARGAVFARHPPRAGLAAAARRLTRRWSAAEIATYGVSGAAVACLGTDGGEGPATAAGAAVDGTTVARARGLGLDAATHLNRNDSFPFFAALGDHLTTGPTGTNVCDLYCVFAWPPASSEAGR